MASPYYRPSGRIGVSLLWRAPNTAFFCILFAWCYAWCGARDNVFLAVVSFVIYFFLLLILVNALADEGKVRSPQVMTMVGLAVAVPAWYANWVFWAAMVQGLPIEWSSWTPQAINAGIRAPGPGRDPIGRYLAAICEFVAFVVLPVLRARGTAGSPYCEAEGKWTEKFELERRFEYIAEHDRPRFIAALEADPDNFVAQLQDFPTDPHKYTLLELHCLPEGSEGFVTIKAIDETTRNDKTDKSELTIVEYLRICAPLAAMAKTEFAHDVTTPQGSPAAWVTPNDEDEEEAAPTPDEIEPALASMQAGQFEEAIAQAAPFCQAAHPQLRNDANRVCALSASRLGQWPQAADYWQALFEHEQTAHNGLQVSTSMVMAGYLSEGEEWFAKTATLNKQTADITPVLMHTNFITALKSSGYLRAAMPYLEWVKSLYQSLHRTDPTFLTMHGVPFLESFIEQSAAVVDASMDKAQAHAWYASMLPHLDQAGQATLGSYLKDKRRI